MSIEKIFERSKEIAGTKFSKNSSHFMPFVHALTEQMTKVFKGNFNPHNFKHHLIFEQVSLDISDEIENKSISAVRAIEMVGDDILIVKVESLKAALLKIGVNVKDIRYMPKIGYEYPDEVIPSKLWLSLAENIQFVGEQELTARLEEIKTSIASEVFSGDVILKAEDVEDIFKISYETAPIDDIKSVDGELTMSPINTLILTSPKFDFVLEPTF